MKKGSLLIAIILLAGTAFTACVSPMGMTAATTPLDGRTYEKAGKSEGRSSAFSIFGLWQVNRTDIDEAVREATRSKNGDALINVTWQERTFWFILIGWHRLEVKGEVIRFTDNDDKAEKGKNR